MTFWDTPPTHPDPYVQTLAQVLADGRSVGAYRGSNTDAITDAMTLVDALRFEGLALTELAADS